MTDQLPDMQTAVEAAGLGASWPHLAPHCRPIVRVLPQAAPAGPLPLGASRLGGADLPAGTAW